MCGFIKSYFCAANVYVLFSGKFIVPTPSVYDQNQLICCSCVCFVVVSGGRQHCQKVARNFGARNTFG